MEDRIKKGLLFFIFIILIAPLSEQCLNYIDSAPVNGAYIISPDTDFSVDSWWNGRFQAGKTKYLNDQTGFRPDLIRLNNQVDFSLFEKLHYFYGKLGKEGCLWDRVYIDAYYGFDFIGQEKILETSMKLKKIQDTLQKLGKSLVLVQAPCKGWYYPTLIPDLYKDRSRGITNLESYTRIADSLGICQFDFNALFLRLKEQSQDLIYAKQGIHWTMFGAALAADSLINFLERNRKQPMPHIYWTKVDRVVNARFTDNDLSKPLNLIFPMTSEKLSYPEIHFRNEDSCKKQKAIYIGDSFLCQWYYMGLFDHINSDWQIWFRFKTVCSPKYPYGDPNALQVKDMDWMNEVKNSDYIVILYTASGLSNLGNGFIEKSYDYFYPKG
jgi:hypothetical protein